MTGLRGLIAAALLLAGFAPSAPADVAQVVSAVREFRMARELDILNDFAEFLTLPNISAHLADMQANAVWLERQLEARGFQTRTVSAGRAPYVLAERPQPGADTTVLIYAHFDGQPVTVADWASPPFQPVLRDDLVERGGRQVPWPGEGPLDPELRVFARSAGDDKAPVIALLAALDALAAANIEPRVNLKLILDGEEEAGSPTLAAVLAAHAERLDADLMLFCDGPMHQSRRRQLVFGVRGSMTVELTTFGANRPLHSGHYGNWAPNPTDDLLRLLGSLKDAEGRIRIDGYYDDVLAPSAAELAAIAAMPDMEQTLMHELGLGRREGGEERLETLLLEPAIVIKGLQAGGVGRQASNVIRPRATASLNLRLVPAQTPESVLARLERHISAQGFHVVRAEPTSETLASRKPVVHVRSGGGYPGFRSPLDGAEAQALVRLLDQIDGEQTLLTPTMGGSLPIYLFDQALDMPIVLLPIANHDNNQHGANENLRLKNLWDAMEIYAVVAAEYGRAAD